MNFHVKLVILLSIAAITMIPLVSCTRRDRLTIAIPNDSTNKARALMLIQQLGFIKLKDSIKVTPTVNDIEENPNNILFREVEAAQLPDIRKEVDFAIINSNYAINAGLEPPQDALALEGAFSAYSNIIAVKAGMENAPIIKALMAAMRSQTVSSFIKTKYKGAVVPTVGLPGNGFDTDIDYSALSGKTITVAASPVPHAKILAIAKNILSQKGIKLVVQEYTDYETPNLVVEDGTFMANYFQHVPYLNDFNRKYNTHLVSAGTIHVEPLGIYAGRSTTLNHLKKQ